MPTVAKARFDTRIPKKQKELFEKAASIGGFRTLTDFILHAAQMEATALLEKQQNILTSQNDQKVFFNALMHPKAPNAALLSAAKRYKKLVKS